MSIINIICIFSNTQFTSNRLVNWIDTTFTATFFYNTFKYFLIPLLIILILYFIAILLINRYKDDKIEEKKDQIEEEINNFLTELLYSNYTTHLVKEKIIEYKKRPHFKYKWFRNLILQKLIHIKYNVKEIDKNLVLIIYKHFDLHLLSKKLIQKRKWYYKSLGFYHYQSLDYKIKKSNIKPYLKSNNKYLRSNALIAMIALSDEKFNILNKYTEKIPRADEIKLLDLIYHKNSTIPKNINEWLKSSNTSVVILAIKLIVRYRASLEIPTITYLLLNNDRNVRKETIIAIRDLVIFNASETLITAYSKERDIRNKISILKTLSIIGDDSVKKFALKSLSKEQNIDLLFELVNCIIKIDPNYFHSKHIKTPSEDTEIINRMILHINCPYLN